MPNKILQQIASSSLYQKIELNVEEYTIIDTCLNEKYLKDDNIDIFCIHCNEHSIFKINNYGQIISSNKDVAFHFRNNQIPVGHLHFVCTRNPNHYFGIVIKPISKGIMKVGQYPSKADIEYPQWDKYNKVIDQTVLSDIKKACGLASHGIGAGSFIYLRRVIENLLLKAYSEGIENKSINAQDFQKARMTEKIVLLKDFLPKILYDNKEAYSILSKGVHELSEEECINYFSLLEETIEIILDEILTTKNRKEKEEEIKRKIATTHTNLKKP